MRIIPIENTRATGKSFRVILNALASASAHKPTFILVSSNSQKCDTFRRMSRIIESYFGENIKYNGVAYENFTIEFPGDGFVKVVTSDELNDGAKDGYRCPKTFSDEH